MKIVESKVFPVRRNDVDTDLIIPADYLKITNKEGLGRHLFERIKHDLEMESFVGRKIMIAGKNFGCGSSREHAPWALKDFGIEVVIAKSFADIFYNNSLKNLLLPIMLEESDIDELFDFDGVVKVDLEDQKVIAGEKSFDFEINSYRKKCLIEEMDDMDFLLSQMDAIKKFDSKRSKKLFFNVEAL